MNCWTEIDLGALARNVERLRTSYVGTELMAVLKADAYGHGTSIIAPALYELGIRHFGVATAAEGTSLRRLFADMDTDIASEVYVMTAAPAEDADEIVASKLIPFVSDAALADALERSGMRQGQACSFHIEVDTGIGRAGMPASSLALMLEAASRYRFAQLSGLCTHFTSGDDRADALRQFQIFQDCLASSIPHGRPNFKIHVSNSPAVLNLPGAKFDMIRPGLLLYGIHPWKGAAEPAGSGEFSYEPVLALKARVLLVRDMPEGSEISYGRTYRLPAPALIATIGIGYGDGYPRRLSNIGDVLTGNGMRLPIRGRVCMDQICVEVPQAALINPGDTVTLIGSCGDNTIRVIDIAEQTGATPHEITTCLTQRAPRLPIRTPRANSDMSAINS